MSENVVTLSNPGAEQGMPHSLDLNSGAMYDAAGNQVGVANELTDKKTRDTNKLLGLLAADRVARMTACSIANSGFSENQELVRQQASDVFATFRANLDERDQQKLDMRTSLSGQALDLGVPDVHIPSAMPNFITGYKNFQPMADVFSPPLVVPKQSDYYYQYDRKDAFQRAIPQAGAAGAGVSEISPRFGSTQYKTITRAIGGFIPTELLSNADGALRLQNGYLRRIVNAMVLEREIRVAAMARTSGNWNSATTIAAGYQWNGGASSDPIKDFHNAIEASSGEVSGAIIPEHIYNAMTRNPAVRSHYTYSGSAAGIPESGQLVSLLKLPIIYVAKMKYLKTDGTVGYVWGNDAILFRAPEQIPPMDQEDVATSYTFRWNMAQSGIPDAQGGLSPSQGMVVRQFHNPFRGPMGGTMLVLCHSDAEKITSAYIGNLLINAYQ